MKILLFVFIMIFQESLSKSSSYYDKFVTDQNSHKMFFRILDYKRVKKTILFDMEKDTDVSLKQSIINGILTEQSIILLNNEDERIELYKNLKTTKAINVVIIAKDINKITLNKLFKKTILVYNHSLVYLIITKSDANYTCNNNKFKTDVFEKIQTQMNDFWHMFQIFKVVVIFPFTCPHKYIIYGGKKPSNKILFDRTIRLIQTRDFIKLSKHIMKSSDSLAQGYPLKASIFERFPTSIFTCGNITEYVKWNKNNTDNVCGLDGLVLNDFVDFFGFNITFPKVKECEKFGYMKSDDNTTRGSLGCVIEGKIDLSFNSRFLAQYSDQDYEYLNYVTTDSLCALLRQPDIKPLWLYPDAFNRDACMLIAGLVLFLGTAAWAFSKISAKIKDERSKEWYRYMLDSCTSTLFGFSLVKLSKLRLIRGTCLLCSIIIMTVYQGHINYSFTTVTHFEKIQTLNELYKSGVNLQTSSAIKALLKYLEKSNDGAQVNFLARAKLLAKTDIGTILKEKNTATLVRKADSFIEVMLKYTDDRHRPLLYVVDECLSRYYLSYITRVGFPFTEELLLFMERLMEAGLPKMYYTWTARSLGVKNVIEYNVDKRPFSQITLEHQRLAFTFLLTGQLISIMLFVVEIILSFRRGKRTNIEQSPSIVH